MKRVSPSSTTQITIWLGQNQGDILKDQKQALSASGCTQPTSDLMVQDATDIFQEGEAEPTKKVLAEKYLQPYVDRIIKQQKKSKK